MSVELKIKTGTIGIIKTPLFTDNINLLYSGMPNNQTFAISLFAGFNSPVIYYPIESTMIHVLENEYKVIEVNKDWIILQPLKDLSQ